MVDIPVAIGREINVRRSLSEGKSIVRHYVGDEGLYKKLFARTDMLSFATSFSVSSAERRNADIR